MFVSSEEVRTFHKKFTITLLDSYSLPTFIFCYFKYLRLGQDKSAYIHIQGQLSTNIHPCVKNIDIWMYKINKHFVF
jgi:hypothetical protein